MVLCLLAYPLQALHELPAIALADLGDLQVLGGLHILAVLLLHLEVILQVISDLGALGNELPAVVLGDLQILGDLEVLGSLADLGDLLVLTLELLYSEQFKVIHGLALVEGDWMARGVNSALLVGEI